MSSVVSSGTPQPASTPANATPSVAADSEINALPAETAAEKTGSKVSDGSARRSGKVSSKVGGRTSKKTSSLTGSQKSEGDERKKSAREGSEYETVCVRRKKPKPFMQRLKLFLSNYMRFDIYVSQVMWEAFKLFIVTSQFNWALEIIAGVLHIMLTACKCFLMNDCPRESPRRYYDSSDDDVEEKKKDEEEEEKPAKKKVPVRTSKPTATKTTEAVPIVGLQSGTGTPPSKQPPPSPTGEKQTNAPQLSEQPATATAAAPAVTESPLAESSTADEQPASGSGEASRETSSP